MRILVVDDEHKIANAIKKGLEQEAYSVDVSYSGLNAYDLAATEEYDLIILDLMLPEMDGFEICEKLRAKNIHTPILMLTARSDLDDKVKGLNTGADDYITKPFAFEELLARVRALLRRPQTSINNQLTCDDLVLNTNTFEVSRGGEKINLSRKEFSLLEYLLRNKDKTLTKDQISSHVWDYDSNILPNTVEQTVRYLRNKIDSPFFKKKQLIQTIRGFGYKITDQDKNV